MAVRIPEQRVAEVVPSRILARCREVVDPALRVAVDQLHPSLRLMAEFSFGWSDPDRARARGSGMSGKGVRLALAVLSAEAVGGSADAGVTGAVAVELVHAFSLVHDDIMDGDEVRRHRPAVWKAYGTGPAVLIGDALFALAVRTVAIAPSEHSAHVVRDLSASLTDLVSGQADDIVFETRPWTGEHAVSIDEYRVMADRKTGSLLSCAAAMGARLADGPPPLVEALRAAGHHLGRAYQAVDDLLGIWGDPSVTGKPVFSDLRRGKKTLPVLAAVRSGTAAGRRLAELVSGQDGIAEGLLPQAADLIEEAGGRRVARREVEDNLAAVLRIVSAAPVLDPAASEIATLARSLGNRTS